jgi:hypothetical protein
MNPATSKTKQPCSVYAMGPVSCYKTKVNQIVILLVTFFLSVCKNLISHWRQNRNYAKKRPHTTALALDEPYNYFKKSFPFNSSITDILLHVTRLNK